MAGALVVGQGQARTALLIEPHQKVDATGESIDALWPTIEAANLQAPEYGHIARSTVTITLLIPDYRVATQHARQARWRNERLPNIVDQLSRAPPDALYAEYPNSPASYEDGFRTVTYRQFAKAINGCARWLTDTLGPGKDHEVITYMGPNDIRYTALILGALKTGYVIFASSPRNSVSAQIEMFERLKCTKLLSPSPKPPPVTALLEKQEMAYLAVPSIEQLLDKEHQHFPFNRAYPEARDEPLWVIHTRGSTGTPKPLTYTLESAVRSVNMFAQNPPPGTKSLDRLMQGKRVFPCFPPFHGACLASHLFGAVPFGATMIAPFSGTIATAQGIVDALHQTTVDAVVLVPNIAVEFAQNLDLLQSLSEKVDLVVQIVLLQGFPSVKGVIQGAVVLNDATLDTMTADPFNGVLSTKMDGTPNLDSVFAAEDLDFFISLSRCRRHKRPSELQCRQHRARRLGTVFFWPEPEPPHVAHMVEDSGTIVGSDVRIKSLGRQGMVLVSGDKIQGFFEYSLSAETRTAGCKRAALGFTPESLAGMSAVNGAAHTAMFTHVHKLLSTVDSDNSADTPSHKMNFREFLASSLGEDALPAHAAVLLQNMLAALIGVSSDELYAETSIADFVLDSLVAFELHNWVMREFDAPLQSSEIPGNQSLLALSKKITRRSRWADKNEAENEPQESGSESGPSTPCSPSSDAESVSTAPTTPASSNGMGRKGSVL